METWLLHFAYIEEKGEESMRKYGESGILLSVVCNRCGKKLAVKEGILREGAALLMWHGTIFRRKMGRCIILICARSAMME